MSSTKMGARLCALLAGAASAALGQQALAQQGAQSAPISVEEIVVTATRSNELLKDVPMAVDVATGEQLRKLNIFDFKDVQQLAPGLELSNRDGRTNTATLRGIAFDPDSGAAPAVDIYFNEMPVDAQTVFTAIYDVNQIEVLRGPQGLLRGRTSPAGAITLKTRPASLGSFEGFLQGTATDLNATNLQGAVSIPLVPGKLAVRLAGLDDRNDMDQVDDVANGDKSHSHTQSARLSLAAQIDALNINLTYQHLDSDTRQYAQVIGAGALLPAGPLPLMTLVRNGPVATVSDRISVVEGPARFRNRGDMLTLQADLDLNWAILSLNAGHQDTRLDQARDGDPTNAVPGYAPVQITRIPYDVSNVEARLASRGEGAFNYSLGANLYRLTSPVTVSQGNDQLISGLPAFLLGLPPEYGVISTFPFYSISPVGVKIRIPSGLRTRSVFGSVSYAFTDRLKLEGGLRYTHYKTSQQSYLTVVAGGATVLDDFATLPDKDAFKSYSAVTGGANLSYQLSDALTSYLSYGHAFRGGVAAVGNTVPLDASLVVTKPEKSDSVEVGLKGELFDRKISFGADVFYQKFDGYLARSSESINASSARNGVIDSGLPLNYNADAVAKGVEGQLSARPTTQWDMSASASYTDAHFKNVRRPCNAYDASGAPVIPAGQQVAFCLTNGKMAESAPFHLTLGSEYRLSAGRFQPFVRGLFTYSPGFKSDVISYHYDDLALLNLFVGVRGPDAAWELTAFARNVFNVEHIRAIAGSTGQRQTSVLTPTFALAPGQSLDSGYRGVSVNAPREVGVTLRASF
jgi:iron complex outermembrane receptor protein